MFIFLFPEFQDLSTISPWRFNLNHCKASPCVLNFSFFLSSFYYSSSSWRLYMMTHQGFNSFSKCWSRFFWKELKYSSSCIPKCNSFYLIFFRWCYVFLDNFPSCFMIQKLSGMRYLNPSFSSLELSWYRFHLKPSTRNVRIMVLTYNPISASHLNEGVFISLLISIQSIVFVSGRISPQFWDVFLKTTSSLLFSLLVFQQLYSSICCKRALSRSCFP